MSTAIEVATRPMTPEEAIKELKQAKLEAKDTIARARAGDPEKQKHFDVDSWVVGWKHRHAALHMAIEALEKASR